MSLPTYMRIAAVVFVLFGAGGFAAGWFGYSGFFGPGVPENGMHVGVGLLFAYFGFSRSPTPTIATSWAAWGSCCYWRRGYS